MSELKYFQASEALKKVCQEFFDKSKVDFFGYARFTKDRLYEFVFTNADLQSGYIEKEFFLNQFAAKDLDEFASGFIYEEFDIPHEEGLELFRAAEQEFGISHFLSYQERHADYCEFFTFGAYKEHSEVLELYLKHLPFLKKFCQLGAPVFRALLKEYNLPTIKIPFDSRGGGEKKHKLLSMESLKLLIEVMQFDSKKNELDQKGVVSEAELKCIKYLLQDKTAKEVARELGLSHRTVEHYYDRIKLKLGVPTKLILKQKLTFGGLDGEE